MRILQRISPSARYTRAEVLRYATSKERKQLQRLSRTLRGRRIVHVNAVSAGGGVAEILKSFGPYLEALGIHCDWYAFNPQSVPPEFFAMTNRLHNALQGRSAKFSPADWKRYDRISRQIAAELQALEADVVVINDPQPLGAIRFLPKDGRYVYISHIDTSQARGPVWRKVEEMIRKFPAVVFSNRSFVHSELARRTVHIFTPAIDPLALKQRHVGRRKARAYLAKYGVPINGPLVAQISRFDIWKNPLGVITAHHQVKQSVPNLQTILVGLKEAKDNPQADKFYRDVLRVAEQHQSVHVFFHPLGIRSIPEFTMMAQNAADIIVQDSLREGFGLTVTEAMWKKKPVIGGPASGIRRQITPKKTGLIALGVDTLANDILLLLDHPAMRRRLGQSAHNSVKKHFLMHRLVLDHLRLYANIVS